MSSLFDFRKWSIEFDGKKIEMEVRPMKSREIIAMLPYFNKIQKKVKEQREADAAKGATAISDDMVATRFDDPESIEALFKIQEKAPEIMANAVRNITGIDDSVQTMCEEMYYLPLVINIMVHVFSLSQLTEKNVKN